MLNVFICEDDTNFLTFVKNQVENYITMSDVVMRIVCATTAPTEVIDCLEKNRGDVGVYFLDLHLETDINGIDLAETIRKQDPRGFIVFITSDSQSYRLTFKHKVEALDYIVKDAPNLGELIHECLDSALEKFTAKSTTLQDNFVFKLSDDAKKFRGELNVAEGSVVSIDNNKIICFTTDPGIKHTVIVYTSDGRLQFGGSLKQVEDLVDKKRFYRCQNNLIINMDKFISFDPRELLLTLEGNLTVPIATRAVKKLNERIARMRLG